ncbi:MAG: hypothetical protein KAU12_03515 [Candidatus Omnitrophica bacterium]|nr:hypothetical protein [Candidatus Omnitrophota bacterium]
MENVCFYCKKQVYVEEFQNPISQEIHPTCLDCQNLITYMQRRRKNFLILGYLRYFAIPFVLLCSIISFIFFNWKIGILFIIAAIVYGIISYLGGEYFVKKKEKDLKNKIKNEL